MIFGHYKVKYLLYKVTFTFYALVDYARLHPVRERNSRALLSSVDYIDEHLPNAIGFSRQPELVDYILSIISTSGHYMEFGVFMGGSIRHIAKKKPVEIIHGFDSFEGLPGEWGGFDLGKGAFSVQGKLPKVPANVKLYKGWFKDTLPQWCAQNPGPVAFVHIDSDIYSSTVDIVNALESRFVPGTIILFDEYFNYPNWQQHEHRAWQEFVARTGIRYEYIGYARTQLAVRITSVPEKQ